jgi:hypothetical protein
VTAWGEFYAPLKSFKISFLDFIMKTKLDEKSHPNTKRHNSMMNHMKRRHLIIALSHDEEKCVEKFGELAKIIPPTSASHLKSKFIN